MENGPVAPVWVVLPLGMIALVVVAGHLLVLRERAVGVMPESRRQIRMVTGWVMMFTIPVIAYGFGIARPSDEETFVLVWTAIVGLIGGIVFMACVDALNNIRISLKDRREIRSRIGDELDRILIESRGRDG